MSRCIKDIYAISIIIKLQNRRSIDDPALVDEIGEEFKSQLDDEIDLLDGASAEFDIDLVTKGELSPVFFGSALTNFGVEIGRAHV